MKRSNNMKKSNPPLMGETKTGKELTPQKLTPVKGDIRFVNTDCSLNECIDKFDSVIQIVEKTAKGNSYYAYYHVCKDCERKHMSSRNKTDTAESKRRADLGYKEV